MSRHFVTPPLPPALQSRTSPLLLQTEVNSPPMHSNDFYLSFANSLAEKCWKYHEEDFNHDETVRRSVGGHNYGSLYVGGLGPCTYLRLRLALHYIRDSKRADTESSSAKKVCLQKSGKLLADGLLACDNALHHFDESGGSCRTGKTVTLLEGRLAGALSVKSAILTTMGRLEEAHSSAQKLLSLAEGASSPVQRMKSGECEVLYGRAGFLQNVLFIRHYMSNPNYGSEEATVIVRQILSDGEKNARRSEGGEGNLPLLWKWHDKAYLGAAHGVCGILFTLLHFVPEINILSETSKRDYLGLVRSTVDKLSPFCFPSGNLASSVGNTSDRLVHWCHGATGYILLLVKYAEIFGDCEYLNMAQKLCHEVVFPRGLLRKGLGLCHGIAGNAYCFLAIHRTINSSSSTDENDVWVNLAKHFANFGIEHLSELENVPDRPFSLYEGLAGFATLLLDLLEPSSAHFPCFGGQ